MSPIEIVDVRPAKDAHTETEYRAYRADLRLRTVLAVGGMSQEELVACARRSVPPLLRGCARAELRRRERLS